MGCYKNKLRLGMSHGKANHLLMRSIIFSLVVRSDRDRCYRCGHVILRPELLSIDHVEPWRHGDSTDLFWNLENIAFSHQVCNSGARGPRRFHTEIDLGMSKGAAYHRLRRNILFALLSDLNLLDCYRCGFPIETVSVLSVDHKRPWIDSPLESFWDLDNIAFSHFQCNSLAHRKPILDDFSLYRMSRQAERTKHADIDGQAWCRKQQAYRPIDQFSKKTGIRHNNLQDMCNPCRRVMRQAEYQARKRRNATSLWAVA
jgi:5-methylcytosine-specific restriction endonuclease McrA